MIGNNEHLVQFYEREETLVGSMFNFLCPTLRRREAVVSIATKSHRDALEEKLNGHGMNIAKLTASGSYIPLDPEEMLAHFMINGMPGSPLFKKAIGRVVAKAIQDFRAVNIFGEMVAVLLEAGNEQGAIMLESFWNDLATKYRFTLFCAYRLHSFPCHPDGAPFTHICKAHPQVFMPSIYER